MGKQGRSKKPQVVGKGKVTPVQIAFIVDRYLSDSGYAQTRSAFRSEASDLISKSPVQEAPKTLLSLGAILDEYITLKEKKVSVDHERVRLDQEKLRVQNLLIGLQGVMNAYNATGKDAVNSPLLQHPQPPQVILQPEPPTAATPAGYPLFTGTPTIRNELNKSSTPVMYQTTGSKKNAAKNVLDCPVSSKRARTCNHNRDSGMPSKSRNQGIPPEIHDASKNGILMQGSNVAKCLFNQETPSPPADSPVPKTPARASSSQTQKSISPVENSSTATSAKGSPPRILSANCTIISAETTIQVTPSKQIAYYAIEQNRISSCSPHLKRSSSIKDHHVRERLDFGSPADTTAMIMEKQTCDGTSTSESEKENSFPLLNFSSLDSFGWDFNLSDLLLDFDMGSEDQGMDSSLVLQSSSLQASGNQDIRCGSSPSTSQLPSNLTGYPEKDPTFQGSETVSTTRSITKRITILSPVKRQRSHSERENCPDAS